MSASGSEMREWTFTCRMPDAFLPPPSLTWITESETQQRLREQEEVIAVLVRLVKSSPLPQWWADLVRDAETPPARTIQQDRNLVAFRFDGMPNPAYAFPKSKRWYTHAAYEPSLYPDLLGGENFCGAKGGLSSAMKRVATLLKEAS